MRFLPTLLVVLGVALSGVAGSAAAAPDRTALALPTSVGPGAPVDALPVGPLPWAQLSAEQRRERRAQYADWKMLGEGERQRIRAAAVRFQALPLAQQQALRERFTVQDRVFRDGWRLGPLLGEHFGRLQGMFGFVPAEQRTQVLMVLRQLSPGQVAQLTLVAQRTPPQERDSVRDAFLAVPAARRDAWLAQQVGR